MGKKKISYSTADIRSFLDDAQRHGLFQRVHRQVDVHSEIGTLCSQIDRPTLFKDLKDYWNCLLVDGLVRNRKLQSIALGIDCGPSDVIAAFSTKIAQGPGQTVVLDTAPVKEVIWSDDRALLSRLPAPVPTEGKNFSHLNIIAEDFMAPVISGAIAITVDPDTGVQNAFFTTATLVDDHTLQFFLMSGHTENNIKAWEDRGEPCPVALVLGVHPVLEFCALYSGDHEGFCELDLASNFLGAPLPLVKCESHALKVPAMSEIVIEGFISAEREPYLHQSSHTDTFAPIASNEPTIGVTTITMRENPIYRHIQPARFTDYHAYLEFMTAPQVFAALEAQGIDVHDVAIPMKSSANCLVVQMTAKTQADIQSAYNVIKNLPIPPRLTVFVDEDIDIYDTDDILYALSVRASPKSDLTIADQMHSLPEPLTCILKGTDSIEVLPNTCWAIDATKPALDMPDRRKEFERTQARGEGLFFIEDYLDD